MSGKGRVYTPNGCSPLHHDDGCAHDGCEDGAKWVVDFLVDGDDIANAHASFPYCDGHVAEYFGYHPDEAGIRTDGGSWGGRDNPEHRKADVLETIAEQLKRLIDMLEDSP